MKKRLVVRFGPGDLAHSGYTQDVSESGIYLQAQIVYPPKTILVLRIEYPDSPVNLRGIVRWAKDLPTAFQRSLKGGMGVEFVAARKGEGAAPAEEQPVKRPASRSGPPPEMDEAELRVGTTRRRQVSTLAGNTFEILETELRGAWYVRVLQLPLTDGSSEAVFKASGWSREELQEALRSFLKSR